MNTGNAFMKCNRDVFIQRIRFRVGECSKYIKNGTGHRNMWQILEITYFAMTDELLLPYVRHSMKNMVLPSVEGYWDFSGSTEKPCYEYAEQTTFIFLHDAGVDSY